MRPTAPQPVTTPMPGQLSEPECEALLFPPLALPKRGPKGKLGSYRVLHLILRVRYTGMQWQCVPVPPDAQGKPAMHYTTVYKVVAKWADDGSLWRAFVASVRHRAVEKQLAISVLHGDGTNTVAKKGAMASAIPATRTKRARQSSPSSTTMGLAERLSPWLPSMQQIWCCDQRA